MALQTISGLGARLGVDPLLYSTSIGTGITIDATGEKACFAGQFFHYGRGTSAKNITTVGFRFGSVTKAGGSALTLSLQDLSAALGPPLTPDETQDQTAAIANGDASFASNTWYTATLSASRSVVPGAMVAMVLEFDGGGRLGADSVVVSGMSQAVTTSLSGASLKSGTWAAASVVPNIIFGCDDGSFGTLRGSFPVSAISSVAYNSGTAGTDEYCVEFSVPFKCKLDGGRAYMAFATSADCEIICYSGTTPITSATLVQDQNQLTSAGVRIYEWQWADQVTLDPGTTYRVAFRPTTIQNVTMYYMDVAAAGHFQATPVGTGFVIGGRINQGAWAASTATRRPLIELHISALSDDVSSGGAGGILGVGSMSGGFI